MSESTSNVLSTWARNIAPSPTLAVDAKAKALKAAGEDVCGFGAGEPDFDTPDFIKDAAAAALAAGRTKYAPTPGIPALRKAIAADYSARGFGGIAESQVVVSPGGKMSCYLAILATVSPGDEVLIPAPYWVSYPEMVKLAGGVPRFIPAAPGSGFKITPAQLRAAITPRSKLLILNSPSNPTGAVYGEAELRALTAAALDAGLLILSDEIYEHLLYDNTPSLSPALLAPAEKAANVITVSGFAKTYSMTGWRLGTLVAAPEIARAVADLQSQTTSNATTFAQYGALAVYEHPAKARAALAQMLARFDSRRLRLWEALNAIPGITCHRSQGAFYLFPDIRSFGLPSSEFAARLLDDERVAVVPGSAFGAEGHVRFSYATSEETIEKGLERLTRFCAKLRG
ncbi:MAG: pyridoxal phosphate-dependent aminotransferase [Puniceicoccales bacterium]|jgi:aspartate aminotransferase|nr:pyridoxal phosphate-dependent aminotransferase [Puniceicoccales bacterium]